MAINTVTRSWPISKPLRTSNWGQAPCMGPSRAWKNAVSSGQLARMIGGNLIGSLLTVGDTSKRNWRSCNRSFGLDFVDWGKHEALDSSCFVALSDLVASPLRPRVRSASRRGEAGVAPIDRCSERSDFDANPKSTEQCHENLLQDYHFRQCRLFHFRWLGTLFRHCRQSQANRPDRVRSRLYN